jgi:hypothetical protein
MLVRSSDGTMPLPGLLFASTNVGLLARKLIA